MLDAASARNSGGRPVEPCGSPAFPIAKPVERLPQAHQFDEPKLAPNGDGLSPMAPFAMADASVRFIRQSISGANFEALGSRGGGEIVTDY